MDKELNRITAAELDGLGVTWLPDVPAMSSAELKAKFEEITHKIVIPRVNAMIDVINEISTSMTDKGIVTAKQIAYWNEKADKNQASYRTMTKTSVIGGTVGWYRAARITLQNGTCYDAIYAVSAAAKAYAVGLVVIKLRNDEGVLTGSLRWIAADGVTPSEHIVEWNGENNTADIYVHITEEGATYRYTVLQEGNDGEYTSLSELTDNAATADKEPSATIVSTISIGIITEEKSGSFAVEDNHVYNITGGEDALTITCGTGHISGARVMLTAGNGTLTIEGATSYSGDDFAGNWTAGDVWELSFLNGYVIGKRWA